MCFCVCVCVRMCLCVGVWVCHVIKLVEESLNRTYKLTTPANQTLAKTNDGLWRPFSAANDEWTLQTTNCLQTTRPWRNNQLFATTRPLACDARVVTDLLFALAGPLHCFLHYIVFLIMQRAWILLKASHHLSRMLGINMHSAHCHKYRIHTR